MWRQIAWKKEIAAIEQQVRAQYKGHPFNNGWAWIVNEYMTFRALAKLGFHSSVDDLDDEVADAFSIISAKIDALKREEMEKKHGK